MTADSVYIQVVNTETQEFIYKRIPLYPHLPAFLLLFTIIIPPFYPPEATRAARDDFLENEYGC